MSKRKAPDNADNRNGDLCDFLIELANYERNVNKNVYKYNAYRKAASSLSTLSYRVKSGDEARKLPGVGEKIGKKIDEFLQTGKLQKLEKINADGISAPINLLTRVSGIGPTKARELVDAGIKTLEDLKKNEDKLTHHQKIGLKYFNDFEKKIPRDEVRNIEDYLKKSIAELDDNYVATICGSYRRGKEESGDVDVLITHPSFVSEKKERNKKGSMLKNLIGHLEGKLIVETISIGVTKFMVENWETNLPHIFTPDIIIYDIMEFVNFREQGICRDPTDSSKPFRRLDIRLVPSDYYYCAVLYFTGSDLFNKNMRTHALQKKFTLNEYTLKRLTVEGLPGEAETITSEEDIFAKLGLPYKKPEERNS